MFGFRRLCLIALCVPSLAIGLSARGAETVVKWDSLKKLDDLAEKCEALCEKKDVAGLRKVAGPVKETAAIVATNSVPAGAKEPEQVKVLQGDLKSLTDSIADPAKQDGEELTAILAAVHPIVEKLMEASGMPHVHEEDKPAPDAKATNEVKSVKEAKP